MHECVRERERLWWGTLVSSQVFTSSESSVLGCRKNLLIRQEGCLPSLGAAGCRWSDIKFCSASHLVAVLAARENSPWASSGFWTSHSALTRPSSDPSQGCAQLIRRVLPLLPSTPFLP